MEMIYSQELGLMGLPETGTAASDSFRLAWERLRGRVLASDLHLHHLGNEAISRFFELGLNIPKIAVTSGHKDPWMLFWYTHLKAEGIVHKL